VNTAFRWIVLGTGALLALALGVPQVAALFKFTAPSATLLALSAALALTTWGWCTAAVALLHRRT
jgi:P-type Ca2+ transporter type 2C